MAEPKPLDVKTTTVGDLCDRGLCDEPTAVGPEVALGEIMDVFKNSPAVRTVAVVDAERKVLGSIPVRRLYEAIFMDVFPEAALGEVDDLESTLELAGEVQHSTAAELMLDTQVLRRGDSSHDAFIRIHRARMGGLLIVDDEERLLAYLDHSALTPLWHVHMRAQSGTG